MMAPFDERLARRYVLGDLSDEELADFEARLFADDELFDELEAYEAEVLDEYARGLLGTDERARLEGRAAAQPQLRGRLAFAGLLKHAEARQGRASSATAPRPPGVAVWGSLAAAAVLLVAAGVVWVSNRPAATQGGPVARGGPQPGGASIPRTETPAPPAPARPVPRNPGVLAFTLTASTVRAGSLRPIIDVPATADLIQLHLLLEPGDEYPGYGVRVTAAGGAVAWSGNVRRTTEAGAPAAVVGIPATRLPAGRYEIVLTGRGGARAPEELAVYAFEIARAPRH